MHSSVMRDLGLRAFLVVLVGAGGCGGATASQPRPRAAKPVEIAPRTQERDSMEVTGVLGTLPQRKIHSVLEGKLGAFQRCFFEGASEVPLIGGDVRFEFAVDVDGRVVELHLAESSVGHRGTERCLLSVARAAKFPSPQGGERAEFSWGFAMEGIADARPPVEIDAARVLEETPEMLEAIAECHSPAPLRVTAYVASGGVPQAAGVASAQPLTDQVLDCVAEVVLAGALPEPGSYTGKVTFNSP